jgi:hypothetical protein
MAIKDLHQRLETLMYCRNGKKVVLLYPYRSEGLPARIRIPENWDSMLASAYDTVKRKIESSFPKNQASVRPSQTTVTSIPTMTHPRRRGGLYDKTRCSGHDPCKLTSSNKNNNNTTSNVSSAERDQLKFLENPAKMPAIITYGFHVDSTTARPRSLCFFCPRSQYFPGTVAGSGAPSATWITFDK